jgi:ActR/RegA family two-component response regulator
VDERFAAQDSRIDEKFGTLDKKIDTSFAVLEQEGLETIQFLRNERPDLKIIAMSGGQYLAVAEKMGADRTLPKPLHAETVLEAVRELLD